MENNGWKKINSTNNPQYGERVLTYRPMSDVTEESIDIISYGSVGKGFPSGVTHWMPLPEPPKQ